VVSLEGTADIPRTLPPAAFAIQTGHGLLLPLVLKRAGGKALRARDFLNGERGLIGRSLGL
jgi:methionyl-tRNA formyltransferase